MYGNSDDPLPNPKKLKTIASNVQYFGGNTILHKFVLDNANRNTSGTESYINAVLCSMSDVPVNAVNSLGLTALQLAVKNENLLMVKKLLSCLKNIDVHGDVTVNSSLHMAVKLGHVLIVEELLKKGADINLKNLDKCTPLCLAVKSGDLAMIKLLLTHGADANSTDFLSANYLHHAAEWGELEALKLLVSHGGDLSATGMHNKTLLHYAAWSGQLEVIKYLICKNANVNAEDDCGCTPIYYAAQYGHLATVEYLVSEGAHLNTKDKDGATPLCFAAESGHLDIVKFILDRIKNVDMNKVFLHASMSDHLETVLFLIKNGAEINIKGGDAEATPLHFAMQQECNSTVVEFLVSLGADVNAKDKNGKTPLHYFAYGSDSKDLQKPAFLIKEGADSNAVDKDGKTPLHDAFCWNNLKYASFLINNGANMYARDNKGSIPTLGILDSLFKG